jgi:hypothetical protein
MLRNFIEKRRKRPSYFIPILFFCLELILMWLVLGIFNWNLDIAQWHTFTYPVSVIWIIFSSAKLVFVLKRQKRHYD